MIFKMKQLSCRSILINSARAPCLVSLVFLATLFVLIQLSCFSFQWYIRISGSVKYYVDDREIVLAIGNANRP